MGYNVLSDEELKDLLENGVLEDYEKMDIINELIGRGSIMLDRVETLH